MVHGFKVFWHIRSILGWSQSVLVTEYVRRVSECIHPHLNILVKRCCQAKVAPSLISSLMTAIETFVSPPSHCIVFLRGAASK